MRKAIIVAALLLTLVSAFHIDYDEARRSKGALPEMP